MNCRFCFPDRSQVTSMYEPAFSGGSWLTTLPLRNLQSATLRRARTTDAAPASTQFVLDMKISRAIDAIALYGHNASAAGTVRIRIGDDVSFTGWNYDSGAVLLRAADIDIETQVFYARHFVLPLLATAHGRYCLCEVSDAGNADGYFELTRFFLGGAWTPSINMSYGAGITWEDDTTSERTLGGIDHYDVRPMRRSQRFALNHLGDDEALRKAGELARTHGTSRPLLYIFDPADTGVKLLMQSMLCTMRKLSAIEYPYVNAGSTAYELLDVLADDSTTAQRKGQSAIIVDGGSNWGLPTDGVIDGGTWS